MGASGQPDRFSPVFFEDFPKHISKISRDCVLMHQMSCFCQNTPLCFWLSDISKNIKGLQFWCIRGAFSCLNTSMYRYFLKIPRFQGLFCSDAIKELSPVAARTTGSIQPQWHSGRWWNITFFLVSFGRYSPKTWIVWQILSLNISNIYTAAVT